MPRKVFTAGEVLAAADVNEFLQDQAVMSFAGTAARGSAIGTAVEGMVTYLNDSNSLSVNNGTDWTIDRTIQVFGGTAARGSAIPSPVEGMYAHLNDTDSLEYYNGSAWVASGGSGALTLIKTQTIGSAVTSVEVTNAFSTDYENYLIMVNGGVGSTGNQMRLQLGSTTTGYFSCSVLYIYSSGTSFVTANNNGASFIHAGAYSTNNISVEVRLQNPFQSKVTMYRSTTLETASGGAVFHDGGMLNNTTSYTAFSLICPTGNITGGTISVYGYKKA